MNKYDAIKVLNITAEQVTIEVIKAAYKVAAKTFHPDVNPAGSEMMVMVNLANETLMKESLPFDLKFANSTNYGQAISDALNSIINCQGIDIEVCGSWVWVSGDTKPYRQIFKDNGFKWSGPKKKWYYRPNYAKRRFKGKLASMDEIRNKYGSESVKTKTTRQIA